MASIRPDPAAEELRQACERAGMDPDRLDPEILARMRLLAACTPTVDDCRRAMDLAEHVFDYFAIGDEPFAEVEKATVRIGSLFSDIGKTGPRHASPADQRLIAQMFAIERVPNELLTITDFLEEYFPGDAPMRSERLKGLGLNLHSTMREFWNLHSTWTLDIMQSDGVPSEAVAAAATHHLLENVNPDSIVAEDGRFTRHFGTNGAFDRPEKLVILLDKYDAARRRGRQGHVEAIAWLRDLLSRHPRFSHDMEFMGLIAVLDTAVAPHEAEIYGSDER